MNNKVAYHILLISIEFGIVLAMMMWLVNNVSIEDGNMKLNMTVEENEDTEYRVNPLSIQPQVVTVEDNSNVDFERAGKSIDSLPEIEGFAKDSFGNYLITENDLETGNLPFDDGATTIQYNFYYDEDNNIINPMPEYYNGYMDLFSGFGG